VPASSQVELGILNLLAPTQAEGVSAQPGDPRRLQQNARPSGPRSLAVPGMDRPAGGVPIVVWENPDPERLPIIVLRAGVEEDVDEGQHTDDCSMDLELGDESGPDGDIVRPAALSTVERPDAPRIAVEIDLFAADLYDGRWILDHLKKLLPRRFPLVIQNAEGEEIDLDGRREGSIVMTDLSPTTTPGTPGQHRFLWQLRYVIEAYEDVLAEAAVLPTVRILEVHAITPEAIAEVLLLTPEDL
jgi:hypothetical protein